MKPVVQERPVAYRDSAEFNAAIYCLVCVAPEDKLVPVFGNPHESTCELCGDLIPLGNGEDDHPNSEFTETLEDTSEF